MGAAPVPPPMYVVEEPVAAAFVGASVGASVAWCEPAWVVVGRWAVAVGHFCFVFWMILDLGIKPKSATCGFLVQRWMDL